MSIFSKPPELVDGETAYADDVNVLADRTEAGFDTAEYLATVHAVAASAFADEAEAWANTAEDTEIEIGKYSSLHFAEKSAGSASAASGSASAAAGSASTASGFVASALDVLSDCVDVRTECEGVRDGILSLNVRENLLINGDLSIWQRGDSQTDDGYLSADRWAFRTGKDPADPSFISVSRDSNTAVHKNVAAISVGAYSSISLYVKMTQKIEGVNRVSGEYVTLSLKAHVDSGTKGMGVRLLQHFGTGGSPSSDVAITPQVITVTTTPTTHTLTFFVPSIIGKSIGTNLDDCLQLDLYLGAGSSVTEAGGIGLQASSDWYIGEIKLERGEEATPLVPRHKADEMRLCERYYEKQWISIGTANWFVLSRPFRVYKRATPTLIPLDHASVPSVWPILVLTYSATQSDYTIEVNAGGANLQMAAEAEL